MSEFKFSCHSCGQKMKAASANVGMQLECPICKSQIVIPAEPRNLDDVPVSTKPPEEPQPPASAPKPDAPGSVSVREKPRGKSLVAKETMEADPQVASLTSEIKHEIMVEVRKTLEDEKHWMPRRSAEKRFNYAAKVEDGNTVLCSVESADATKFSLFGAILKEFHKRNVTRTAAGRNRFLDIEVIEAIIETGTGKPYVPEYQGARPPKGADDDIALDHSQTLKAVDLLVKRYEMEAKGISFHPAAESKHVRLADLIRKLEREQEITTDEVTKAFEYELKFIDKRLTDLERHIGRG